MSEESNPCPTAAVAMANYSAATSTEQKENNNPVDLGYTKTDFNKDTLNNLKTMFESKKNDGDDRKMRARPVKSSSGALGGLMSKFSQSSSDEVARCMPKSPLGYSSSSRVSNNNNSASISESNQLNGNTATSPVPIASNTSVTVNDTNEPVKTIAGEKEVPKYKPSVSLKDAMSVFNQGNKAKEYVPKNNLKSYKYKANVSINSSSSNDKNVSSENQQTIFRNVDKIDDRPKQLTTSLSSAKSRFENNNNTSENNNGKKEIATWEGKESGDASIMKSAKSVFTGQNKPNNNEQPLVEAENNNNIPTAGKLDKNALEAFSKESEVSEEVKKEESQEVQEKEPSVEEKEPSVEEKEPSVEEKEPSVEEKEPSVHEEVESQEEVNPEEIPVEPSFQEEEQKEESSEQPPTPIKRSSVDQTASNNEVSEENQ